MELQHLLSVVLLTVPFVISAICARDIHPVGDEKEYIERATASDPFYHPNYVRVPAYIALFLVGCRLLNNSKSVQFFNVAIGLCVGLTTIYAIEILGGSPLLGALAFIVMLEFSIFSFRLWPEPILSFLHILVILLLVEYAQFPFAAIGIGLLALVAALIRIEQIILAPAASIVLYIMHGQLYATEILIIVVPTVLGLAGWAAYNYRSYGILFPDTTARFNIAVAIREAMKPVGERNSIEQLVREERFTRPVTGRTLKFSLLWRVPRDILLRFLSFLGQETFITQRLMPPSGSGYRRFKAVPWLGCWLRYGYSCLFFCAIVASSAANYFPVYLLPSLLYVFSAVAVHSRTRYRQVTVPACAMLFAIAGEQLDPGYLTVSIIAGVLMGWALARRAIRNEVG